MTKSSVAFTNHFNKAIRASTSHERSSNYMKGYWQICNCETCLSQGYQWGTMLQRNSESGINEFYIREIISWGTHSHTHTRTNERTHTHTRIVLIQKRHIKTCKKIVKGTYLIQLNISQEKFVLDLFGLLYHPNCARHYALCPHSITLLLYTICMQSKYVWHNKSNCKRHIGSA